MFVVWYLKNVLSLGAYYCEELVLILLANVLWQRKKSFASMDEQGVNVPAEKVPSELPKPVLNFL